MRTDEELKDIALKINSNEIFTDRHIPEEQSEMLPIVFMPLGLMSGEELTKAFGDDPGLAYEYMNKAGPRSINGFPSFFSMQVLDMEETIKVDGYIKKIRKAIEEL